jgi:hypothetical protein
MSTSLPTRRLRIIYSRNMPPRQAMRPRRPCSHSSTRRVTGRLFPSIRRKPICITHLLHSGVIRAHKWHSGIDIGQGSVHWTIATKHWTGTRVLLSKVHLSVVFAYVRQTNIGAAMNKFTSGPPGGLTLPQTATRLSDLAGGVYGPGASVASTGANVVRPAIKAGLARAAGETWEDVLDYYMVNVNLPD